MRRRLSLGLCHVPSANNLADIFTKILGVETGKSDVLTIAEDDIKQLPRLSLL